MGALVGSIIGLALLDKQILVGVERLLFIVALSSQVNLIVFGQTLWLSEES